MRQFDQFTRFARNRVQCRANTAIGFRETIGKSGVLPDQPDAGLGRGRINGGVQFPQEGRRIGSGNIVDLQRLRGLVVRTPEHAGRNANIMAQQVGFRPVHPRNRAGNRGRRTRLGHQGQLPIQNDALCPRNAQRSRRMRTDTAHGNHRQGRVAHHALGQQQRGLITDAPARLMALGDHATDTGMLNRRQGRGVGQFDPNLGIGVQRADMGNRTIQYRIIIQNQRDNRQIRQNRQIGGQQPLNRAGPQLDAPRSPRMFGKTKYFAPHSPVRGARKFQIEQTRVSGTACRNRHVRRQIIRKAGSENAETAA